MVDECTGEKRHHSISYKNIRPSEICVEISEYIDINPLEERMTHETFFLLKKIKGEKREKNITI